MEPPPTSLHIGWFCIIMFIILEYVLKRSVIVHVGLFIPGLDIDSVYLIELYNFPFIDIRKTVPKNVLNTEKQK